MPVPVRRLLVRPNPWIEGCIDHFGRPAGRVAVDPHEHSPIPATFVGCKFVDIKETVPEQITKIGKREISTAPARHDHRIAYSKEDVSIPNTGYYRDALKRGDLFPADAKTARAVGIAKFVPPDEALKQARESAIEHFNANTGEDAHAEMHAEYEGGEPLWLATEADLAAESVASQANATAEASAESAPKKASAKSIAPPPLPAPDPTSDPKGGV